MSTAGREIAYVANIRFPTEKAHGYQIARVCAALSAAGSSTTLVVPTRRTPVAVPWHEYYGLPDSFIVRQVWCPDMMRGNVFFDRLAFIFQGVFFACTSLRTVEAGTTVLTRDTLVAFVHSLFGKTVFFVAHKAQTRFMHRFLLRRVKGIIANSEGTGDAFERTMKVPVTVIHNGSDLNSYREHSKDELRDELQLSREKTLALYSGHLYSWKGIGTLIDAAEHLREHDTFHIVVVGGLEKDVVRYRTEIEKRGLHNIVFLGHQSKQQIPKYLAAADILLLPNNRQGESTEETSPLKLFEYLAAGKPIIVSDLPSIRRIVSEEAAFFVPPGDGAALALAIEYARERTEESAHRAESALLLSKLHTWEHHAERILQFTST